MLTRMTPEGSREYLVPSRVHPGRFYALPQSPQVFKQLIMVGGMDRYFQIARCLRDEDLRADRQPEFTQLDLELSFGDEEDVFAIIEKVLSESIQAVFHRTVPTPFPRLKYRDAMLRFGVDKPDLRFGLEIQELSEIWRGAGFRVVDDVLAAGGVVRGLRVEGGAARLSRKEIDALTPFVQGFGAKGVAFLKLEAGQLVGPLAKFTDASRLAALTAACGFAEGDLLLIVADRERVVCRSLGELRNDLARRLDLLPKDGRLAFSWIVDFPMFDWSDEEQRYVAAHHPFTTPLEEYAGQMAKEPGKVLARAYDLVMNGGNSAVGRCASTSARCKAVCSSSSESRRRKPARSSGSSWSVRVRRTAALWARTRSRANARVAARPAQHSRLGGLPEDRIRVGLDERCAVRGPAEAVERAASPGRGRRAERRRSEEAVTVAVTAAEGLLEPGAVRIMPRSFRVITATCQGPGPLTTRRDSPRGHAGRRVSFRFAFSSGDSLRTSID